MISGLKVFKLDLTNWETTQPLYRNPIAPFAIANGNLTMRDILDNKNELQKEFELAHVNIAEEISKRLVGIL